MKNKCAVVRDLMPLVIDGASSEESAEFVREHVSQCPPCAEMYGEMKAELPRQNAEKAAREKAEFDKTARAIKRRRRWKALLRTTLCLLACIVLLLGGLRLYTGLTAEYSHPLAEDEYSVTLLKRQDGAGVVVFKLDNQLLRCSPGMNLYYMGFDGSGDVVMELGLYAPAIRQYMPLGSVVEANCHRTMVIGQWQEDGWHVEKNPYNNPVTQVKLVTQGAYPVIYEQGAEVPYCSVEMEAYFAFRDNPDPQMSHRQQLLELERLMQAVPEWQ